MHFHNDGHHGEHLHAEGGANATREVLLRSFARTTRVQVGEHAQCVKIHSIPLRQLVRNELLVSIRDHLGGVQRAHLRHHKCRHTLYVWAARDDHSSDHREHDNLAMDVQVLVQLPS